MSATDTPGVAAQERRGARIFISYAHADEALRSGLRKHMSALERDKLVQAWDDRQIPAGDDFADAIDERLNRADVILLLVSADFIGSEYCFGKELKRALERNDDPADRAIVIPIILRRCDWQSLSLARLQALPRDGKPLADWPTADDYYTAVTQGLRKRLLDAKYDWPEGPGPRDPRWWERKSIRSGAVAIAVLGIAAGAAWWREIDRVDVQVAQALQHLRSARYRQAEETVRPACEGLVRRDACFVLDKVMLGRQLERPDQLDLETFASRLKALQDRTAREDPDLLLYAGGLALKLGHPEGRARIERALELTRGQLPEAHFFLASLDMYGERYADALPKLERALDRELNPAPPLHYLNARAYARARTGDLAGAIQDYEDSAALVLSRIELAELLWTVSDFERASDQLREAARVLAGDFAAKEARNALPWTLKTATGVDFYLVHPQEKRCLAGWLHRAGLALADRPEPDEPARASDCGPQATRIASAVSASLARAAGWGMNDTGRERARRFALKHGL